MQEVRKGRVSSLGTAILVTTENAKDAEGTGLFSWNGNFECKRRGKLERVSSLGTAISVISKNVKDAERTFSSFGVVIGNRGKCEVDVWGSTWIDSTHRLVWSTTASVLIFGFGYIGFGFSFWVLDSFLAIKRRTAHFGCGFRYDGRELRIHFGRHFELVLCLLDAILVRL
ncbi:uncharacterized protein OCT59_006756 [Rhizophagus irregularis]|uniref:uncharacterized protein n=1 Tax=Rhizophagus irregularis TaxID=588596 RepID=UPI00332CA8C7|nr:hypothetical protein OCT59_006756 [Rhizophagus irregularis]